MNIEVSNAMTRLRGAVLNSQTYASSYQRVRNVGTDPASRYIPDYLRSLEKEIGQYPSSPERAAVMRDIKDAHRLAPKVLALDLKMQKIPRSDNQYQRYDGELKRLHTQLTGLKAKIHGGMYKLSTSAKRG